MLIKLLGAAVFGTFVGAAEAALRTLGMLDIKLTADGGGVSLVGVIGIVSAIVGLATGYLRLYVGNELGKLKIDLASQMGTEMGKLRGETSTLVDKIRTEAVPREVHQADVRRLDGRIDTVEKDLRK